MFSNSNIVHKVLYIIIFSLFVQMYQYAMTAEETKSNKNFLVSCGTVLFINTVIGVGAAIFFTQQSSQSTDALIPATSCSIFSCLNFLGAVACFKQRFAYEDTIQEESEENNNNEAA